LLERIQSEELEATTWWNQTQTWWRGIWRTLTWVNWLLHWTA